MPDLDPLTEFTRSSTSLDSLVTKHAARTGLDPELVSRLVGQESRGRSNAVSPKGAGGLGQLMPATARSLGVKNVFDPDENLRGSTDYLKQQLDKFGDVNLALAAYNAGPGAVIKHGNKVPPYAETQNYVKKIGGGYQGTGYAQDPLTTFTQGKAQPSPTQPSDPLSAFTQGQSESSTPARAPASAEPTTRWRRFGVGDETVKPEPIKFTPADSSESNLNRLAQGSQNLAEMVRTQGVQLPANHPDLLGKHIEARFTQQPTAEQVDDALLEKLGKGYGDVARRFREEMGVPLTNGAAVERQADGSFIAHARPTQGFIDAVNAYALGGRQAYEATLNSQTAGKAAVARDMKAALRSGEGIAQDIGQAGSREMLKTAQFGQNLTDLARLKDPENDPSALAIARAAQTIPQPTTWTGSAAETGLGTLGAINRAEALGGGAAFPVSQAIEAAHRGPEAAYKAAILTAPLMAMGPIGKAVGADELSAVERQALLRGVGGGGLAASTAASGGSPRDIATSALTGAAFPVGAREGNPDVPLDIAAREAKTLGVERAQTVPDFQREIANREAAVNSLPSPRGVRVRDQLRGVEPAEISTTPTRPPAIEQVPESLGVVGPTKPVIPVEEGAKLNRWQHRDFGLVTESTDQSSVGKGRVRVMAEDGTQHVIQRPNGRGQNNQIAVPVRSKPEVVGDTQEISRIAVQSAGERFADPEDEPTSREAPTPRVATAAPKTAETKVSEPPAQVETPTTADVKARSFPQTLAETGREKGNDLFYEQVTDRDAVAKANERIQSDPEAARQYVLQGGQGNADSPQGKERIATGLRLADGLIEESGKESDPVVAADKHAKAVELYSKLAGDLTEAGQTVQAANLARRYSPAGAVLEATRVAGERLKPEVAQLIREAAQRHASSDARITELETQIEQMRSQLKNADSGKPRSFREKAETLQDRLAKLETDARARLEARKALTIEQTTGPRGQRGAAANPAGVALDIADHAVIGASKLARGGLDFAKWSDEMIKDLGEEIRPHLDRIFQASRKRLDEERASVRTASAERSVTKILTRQGKEITPETIKAALEEKANLQAERRQARVDLDRHFRELEDAGKNTGTKVATSMLRDGLLSLHGYLKILSGMTAKQVADTAGRVTESLADTARVRGAQLFGGQVPRTSTAASVSPRGLKYTADYLAKEGLGNVGAAIRGKSSEIAPAHGGITGNPYADAAIAPMQRLYASKEALFRSWAYPQERYNQASILARNDAMDGVISRGEIPARTKEYLSGRLEIEGSRNKQYAEAMAKNAAQYEVRSKQIIRSMENARTKELASSPRELIDSLARQYADNQVYAQPNRPSEIVQGARGIMRKAGMEKPFEVAQATVLPFVKRPANAVADAVFTYTGARIPVEAIRNTLGRGWGPAETRSFNQAIARGGAGAGLFAIGMALGKKGVLTPADDKKSVNVKRASGYQDGAIHVGDNYYQIKNVPFIGWLLVAGATAEQRGFSSVPGAVTNMIAEHPLIRSGVETFDTVKNYLTSPEKQAAKAPEAAARWASRFVPSLVNAAGEATDTKAREVKGVAAQFESRIPGLRNTLPAQRTVFAEDIPKSRASFIAPFRLSEGRETPATREMIRLSVDIGTPKQTDKETAVQFQKYKETVGPLLKKNLDDLVQTRGYKQLSDEKKADALHAETKRIEEEVRKRITPEGGIVRGALPRKREERTMRASRLVIP